MKKIKLVNITVVAVIIGICSGCGHSQEMYVMNGKITNTDTNYFNIEFNLNGASESGRQFNNSELCKEIEYFQVGVSTVAMFYYNNGVIKDSVAHRVGDIVDSMRGISFDGPVLFFESHDKDGLVHAYRFNKNPELMEELVALDKNLHEGVGFLDYSKNNNLSKDYSECLSFNGRLYFNKFLIKGNQYRFYVYFGSYGTNSQEPRIFRTKWLNL